MGYYIRGSCILMRCQMALTLGTALVALALVQCINVIPWQPPPLLLWCPSSSKLLSELLDVLGEADTLLSHLSLDQLSLQTLLQFFTLSESTEINSDWSWLFSSTISNIGLLASFNSSIDHFGSLTFTVYWFKFTWFRLWSFPFTIFHIDVSHCNASDSGKVAI